MWSYYGRKSRVVKYYPKPIHDTIIEPFAGTACYSLHENNWEKDVILVDKYDVIIRIWQYLQNSKPEDILKLPDMFKGDKVDNFKQLIDEEKWLIGFCINRGATQPKKTASNYNSWNQNKIKIANEIHKIKHWKLICGDYKDLENIDATWFIDPPYQERGFYYKYSDIDYDKLSDWCKTRNGQVIVCENTTADWMDFKPLKDMQGLLYTTTEAMWYKEN